MSGGRLTGSQDATLFGEVLGKGYGFGSTSHFIGVALLGSRPITLTLVCKSECHIPFRKPLRFIVMSVMAVINAAFPIPIRFCT
jgi:hypothetical protein